MFSKQPYPFMKHRENPPLEHWKILVIDDQQENLVLTGRILSSFGAEVALADNPHAAIEMLKFLCPTVILLDLAMPEMSGLEAIKLMRASMGGQAAPIIAHTVRVSLDDLEKAKAAGFDGFIAKPYTINGIVEQLQRIVRNHNTSKN